MKRKRRLAWRRWETWVGAMLCGLAALLGNWLGHDFRHPQLGALVGGIAGSLLLSRMTRHVIRRHYTHDPG
ncbi:hypothetical protein CS053_00530 [Rhodanobacter glycinis]|uniref:Uncharacterized protein n=1 Tax=Rhodanobacter glycinis TaxID=582702 RepID=A0A5B9DYD4_9GAMM|nr:hypothetical protein [Rhodanobacter glycinis]QEE23150.1 hypothetical protein CS053_00530 [Rhodanobacter glycinis]